ncbi:MAG: formylmethanofuran dehydrogenase subunit A [Candidatus Methylarchaceae archaeon HK02M2]|nr:formylmethanofuran dehydrogenase subunit A [Candidatus Methylarchaceae archaeon HK02M2]
MELLIKNGVVYDPINKIDGEVMDIAIKDNKIVDMVDESKAYMIDASNKLVMAGGVDVHTHIAGPKMNTGRILRPEDHYGDVAPKTQIKRSGGGYSTPSSFVMGYRYAEMGYTTAIEPANSPIKMLHCHHEFRDIPILDKSCFVLFGNNWFVWEYLMENKLDECAAYVAWVLNATKGYAIKIVDPGAVEAWKWGDVEFLDILWGRPQTMDQQVPRFGITSRDIIRGLCKVNKLLNLPHPIHVHPNGLGTPGNYQTTIETMDCVKDLADGDKPIIHMTHVQFNGYGGSDWVNFRSGAYEIMKYVNANKHVSMDLGQVIFTNTTTMTGDGPFEYRLYRLTKNKWTNADVEVESGAGIVPMHYKRNNFVHAVMWAIGLELALFAKDPWRVFITTDHPNGGPFTNYPKLLSWLMSKEARQRIINKIPKRAKSKTNLESMDREYSFYEIATTTRAATAKILGLKDKGHLGVGADADISIYDMDPKEINPSKDYKQLRKAFSKAMFTIKEGEIVVKDGETVKSIDGRVYWVKPNVPSDLMNAMESELAGKFDDYYTVSMQNFKIPERYIMRSTPIAAHYG